MKKLLSVILSTVLLASLFTACGAKDQTSSEDLTPSTPSAGTTIRLAGMKGPTSMGLVSLLDNSEKGQTSNTYDFTMAGAADEITPKLIQGELDIAAVPANLASVLYNNTQGKIKLLAVNTLGVLYLVEQGNTIQSLSDLKGKTIYATGKGTTPEYTLKYLLSQNGLDPEKDVTIEWRTEATEIVALMQQDPSIIALLPQPFVTVAQTQIENLHIALDFNKEWQSLDNGSMMVTGVLVVRDEFAKQNPEAIELFLKEYEASTTFINDNVQEGAALVEKYNIIKAPIAQKSIPYCNITFLSGEEMKQAVNGYLQVLWEQNPKSVGGTLPADDFYYEK